MSAPDIYAKQLSKKDLGYPLWQPDPGENPAVEIADVGYTLRGAFIRLFNASKNTDDRTSNELGVPTQYRPLTVGPIQKDSPLPTGPIRSESVSGRSVGLGLAGGMPSLVQASGSLNFRCEDQEGAILILGDFAYREEVLSKRRFLDYILAHHQAWLIFANNKDNARGIAIDDLILVTGCAKTSKWACAAFSDKSRDSSISFRAGSDITAGHLVWGKWEETHSVDKHSGPQRLVPPGHLTPQITITTPQQEPIGEDESISDGPPQTKYNQCVFLRGFRICDRKTLIMRKVGIATKAHDGIELVSPNLFSGSKEKTSKDLSGNSRSIRGTRSDSQSDETKHTEPSEPILFSTSEEQDYWTISTGKEQPDKEEIDLFLQLNYDRNPSLLDALLYYILEVSNARLAIVHDDDLAPFLREANIDDFGNWLYERNPEVHVDNHVGMLDATYQVFLSGHFNNKQPQGTGVDGIQDIIPIEYKLPDLTTDVEIINIYPRACGRRADIFLGEWNSAEENTNVVVRALRRIPTLKLRKRQLRFMLQWYNFHHPNILALHGVYIFPPLQLRAPVSPLLHGNVVNYLDELKQQGHECTLLGRLHLLVGVASALDYLHNFAPKILHCDIKGDKVLVSDAHEAILGGFGKSRILNDDDQVVDEDEESDELAEVSLRWMAPEVLASGEASPQRFSTMSDVYAFGCLMVQILNDQIPWSNIEADASVLIAVTHGGLPPVPDATYLPMEIKRLMESCWSRNIYARPPMDQVTSSISRCARRIEERSIPPPYSEDPFRTRTVTVPVLFRPTSPPPPFSRVLSLASSPAHTRQESSSREAMHPMHASEQYHRDNLGGGLLGPTDGVLDTKDYSEDRTSRAVRQTEQQEKGKSKELASYTPIVLSIEEFFACFQPIVQLIPMLDVTKGIVEICQNVYSNRSEARQLQERCRYLLVALQDKMEILNQDEIVSVVTGCTQQLNHVRDIVSRWPSLRFWESFMELETISEEIKACHTIIDILCKDCEIPAHSQPYHWVTEFNTAKGEDHAARLAVLEDIDGLNEGLVVADHQDISILLKLLQISLGSIDHDTPTYQALEQALYHISRSSGELVPFTDLHAAEVRRTGDFPVGGSATYDIWEGIWLGREKVAMKVVRGVFASPEIKKRFLHEVNIWRKVWAVDRGRHIVPYYGTSFEDGPYPSVVSPWMENGNVLDYLKGHPSTNRRELIKGIAKGLSLLHNWEPRAIAHGDIRAVNILVGDSGQPLLADFGLPKILEDITSVPFTQSKGVSESYRWFAPELFTSPGVISARSDTFAYAMTVIEIMTGCLPFSHLKRTTEVLLGIQRGDRPRRPDNPEVLARGLDDHIWSLLTRCWAAAPSDRPTIDEVLSRL